MGSYANRVEFLGEKSCIDRERIIVLDTDDASHGWLLSSSLTPLFSKMHLNKPRQLQTSRSHGYLNTKGSENLVACRVSSKELRNHLSLDTLSDSSDHDLVDLYSDSSLSDISFNDEHFCSVCSSYTNSRDKHGCGEWASEQESERLWALWSKEDSPIQKVSDHMNDINGSRVYLPSMFSDLEIHDHNKNFPRPNAYRSPDRGLKPTSSYRSPPKINSPPPRRPPPPPRHIQTITIAHPQHKSWPIVTIPHAAPHFPSQRSRAHTVPSDSRPRRPSKLSTCMTNEYPSSQNPYGSITTTCSAPTSPFYPFEAEDLMSRMHKSVFDFESEDEDEDDDRNELPDWLRRLTPRKGAGNKDLLVKAPAEFIGRGGSKEKKNKSFSHLGEFLKRSLRIRKSGDF